MGSPAAKYFRPGQYVFHEGDSSSAIYLIKKGTVAVRKRKGAAYIELGRIYSNEILGELSFFDQQPRSAAAIALTEVEVLEIPFENLEKIFQSVPSYMKTIVAAMAERLRKAGETIKRLDDRTVRGDAEGASTDTITASDALAMLNEKAPEGEPEPEGEKS